jgi:ribonuclease-3 family protein
MLFLEPKEAPTVHNLPMRLLAHLGDAVFHLYEREREILFAVSAKELHNRVVLRVNADMQAKLLDQVMGSLNEAEADIVRRARNIKATGSRRPNQANYRKSTAFEALLGYLYLTDQSRMKEILSITLLPE